MPSEVYDYEVVADDNTQVSPDGLPPFSPPEHVDNVYREGQAKMARFLKSIGGSAVTTGTPNAYNVVIEMNISALAEGMVFVVEFHATNVSGSATINFSRRVSGVDTLVSNKELRVGARTALAAGELATGQRYLVQYDGTHFQLLNPTVVEAPPVETQPEYWVHLF